MKPIYLIACGSLKSHQQKMAKDLYLGALFQKARAYAEATGGPWFILSGLYGLVFPDTLLNPYEYFLGSKPEDVRREWARNVVKQLKTKGRPGRIVILAGRHYWEFLKPLLEKAGYKVEIPLEGLAIGKQIQWLMQNKRDTTKKLF